MSTIRYTAGGDYDPLNSVDITPLDAKGPFSALERFVGPSLYNFEIVDRTNSIRRFDFTNFHTDGIYADFSDNTRGALLAGGDVADVLIGGRGRDTILGLGGPDRLFGGAGADTFIFRQLSDLGGGQVADGDLKPPHGRLTLIEDFSGEARDKIDLSDIASFRFDGGHHFAPDGEAQIYVTQNKHGVEIVHGDLDGDGAQDFSLRVRPDAPLTAGNFILSKDDANSDSITTRCGTHYYDTHPAFTVGLLGIEHLAIA